VCKFPAGQYGKRISVAEDGAITIDKKAYADDIVAFVSGAIDADIKVHLTRFVNAMDARAVARHGYSHSPEEAAFVWNDIE